MELFKRFFQKKEDQKQTGALLDAGQNGDPNGQVAESQELENEQEEVTFGTKIKVVAALLIVGFAAYIAYWIQEPVEVRTDLLGSSSQAESQMLAGQTQQVSILNYSFNPATMNVNSGTTVIWTNNDPVPHNVTSDNFASPTLNPGQTFNYTFNSAGSFTYQSTFDPQMKGYITVAMSASESQASAKAAKQQVLSGFGAGSVLGLQTPPAQTPAQTQAQSQAGTQTSFVPAEPIAAAQTQTQLIAPEIIYHSNAPAPANAGDLHNAAFQSLSASLNNLGTAAANNATTTAQQQALSVAQGSQGNTMAKGKLASSGPEDYVYMGMFGLTLLLNRRKLYNYKKSGKAKK